MPKSPPAYGFGTAHARGKEMEKNKELVPPGTYNPEINNKYRADPLIR
jgi:hypothetical protein